MESLIATRNFARPGRAGCAARGPLVLDALHALQCWRGGHPGRTFRFIRSSPFADVGGLSARLQCQPHDSLAYGELDRWCDQYHVSVVAATAHADATPRRAAAPAAG